MERLVGRFSDQGGQLHIMVAEAGVWSSCRSRHDPLREALSGLPGVQGLSCQTGLGWKEELLLRIGWPIWLTHIGYQEAATNRHTPTSVLTYLLQFRAYSRVVLGNPNMTPELFSWALQRWPEDRSANLRYSRHRLVDLTDEQSDLAGLELEVLAEELPEMELAKLPKAILQRLSKSDGANQWKIKRALAIHPGCPEWLMEELQRDDLVRRGLLDNPATPAWILEEFMGEKGGMGKSLEKIASHPLVSLDQLARLSLGEQTEARAIAGTRLAERLNSRRLEMEVESSGTEVSLEL